MILDSPAHKHHAGASMPGQRSAQRLRLPRLTSAASTLLCPAASFVQAGSRLSSSGSLRAACGLSHGQHRLRAPKRSIGRPNSQLSHVAIETQTNPGIPRSSLASTSETCWGGLLVGRTLSPSVLFRLKLSLSLFILGKTGPAAGCACRSGCRPPARCAGPRQDTLADHRDHRMFR